MGFSKVLVLLVFLGAAAYAKQDAQVLSVDKAVDTVEGCVIDCSAGGYHQHPSDCTKFVHCTPSGPVVMPCPEETVWDQENTVCNHDESVACETGSYLTPEGKSCPETNPGFCFFWCPEEHGKFAHPRDCERYFHCVHWIPVPKKCNYGLHFNERSNRCGLPFFARCQASPDAEC